MSESNTTSPSADLQRQLCRHIRDPEQQAGPANVEDRRLKVYRDLFYKNIEGFLSGTFPVLRSCYEDDVWHAMVRAFIRDHRCETPYFLKISEEFLAWFDVARQPDKPFAADLAHYEWVELALDVDSRDLTTLEADPDIDLLQGRPVLNPVLHCLQYAWPVHHISGDFQPQTPLTESCVLLVYRDRSDKVGFMEINAVTAALIALLDSGNHASGAEALLALGEQLQHPDPQAMVNFGAELLQQLLDAGVLLGALGDSLQPQLG